MAKATFRPTAKLAALKSKSVVDELLQDQIAALALRKDGPIIDVTLHPVGDDGKQHEPVTGKALIDTGADRTAVDLSKLQGVKPSGSLWAQGATGQSIELPVYSLHLGFPDTRLGTVELSDIAGTPHLEKQGIVALIGRDVLGQGKLVYDGPKGMYTLKMPGGKSSVSAAPYGMIAAVGAAAVLGAVVFALWPAAPAS